MKIINVYMVIINLIICSNFLPGGTLEKEFQVSPGEKLSVNLQTGGSISVEGWDKNIVKVLVEFSGKGFSDEILEFNKHSSGLDVNLSYDVNDYLIDLSFKVPKKFDINIETMGGGIRISDVEGRFTGQTMGGSLQLENLKGKIDLTTMGGNITLRNSELDGNLSTMGGKVFFENVIGDVKGTSMGGNVIYRNVKDRSGKWEAKDKEVNISTMGGEITVDNAPMGARVKTMGGDIEIDNARGYVDATTMGGNIVIGEIDGWIKAKTMGGNIKAVMVGNPDIGKRDIALSSMGGNIDLTLPEGFSAKFEVRLTYTKNSRKNYKIESDFPLTIKESKEWIYSNGSPRKYIEGTGIINSGKHRIIIDTINGDIRIRKGNK